MEILIDPQAGFCPGVRRAIELVEKNLRQEIPVAALGSLIHNRREIERLEKIGLRTVAQEVADSPQAVKALKPHKVFVRTHGVGTAVQQHLREAEVEVIDGTCGTVRRVQKLAALHHQRGDQVVIIGKKGHAEVTGILGHCDGQGIVVESEADIGLIDPDKPTLVIAQTTAGSELFTRISQLVGRHVQQVNIVDTLCRHISRRYGHIRDFAASVDVLIFVGGRESSNSKVLFEICRQANPASYKIESAADLEPVWFAAAGRVGITGGASTPPWQFDEIRAALSELAASPL